MTARSTALRIAGLAGATGSGAPLDQASAGRALAPFLESAEYTDRAHGEADSVDLVFSDRDGRFTGRTVAGHPGRPDWRPARGDRFRLALELSDWERPGQAVVMPWGTVEVDEVEATGGTAGTTVRVRCQSAAVLGSARGFRGTAASRTIAPGSSLRAVCAAAAERHGLALLFGGVDVPFPRAIEQRAEADATFLRRLCEREHHLLTVREAGPSGRVHVVVTDEATLADQDGLTVRPGGCSSWRFREALHGRFKAAECSYFDARKGEVVSATAKASDWTDAAETLRVEATVASQAEALRIATAALRRQNRAGLSGSVSLAPGAPGAASGSVVVAEGFGGYDGRYLVDTARHRWAATGGYTTDLDLVRLP